jgi:hypothetical protein
VAHNEVVAPWTKGLEDPPVTGQNPGRPQRERGRVAEYQAARQAPGVPGTARSLQGIHPTTGTVEITLHPRELVLHLSEQILFHVIAFPTFPFVPICV